MHFEYIFILTVPSIKAVGERKVGKNIKRCMWGILNILC